METRKNDKFIQAFGNRVRELRLSKGKTQSDIAVLLNTDRAYVGKIENGKKEARISFIVNFCKAIDIDIKDFFDFDFT